LTSPSLDGILSHTADDYQGIRRPVIINRIFDKPPGMRNIDPLEKGNQKIIEDYFHDLYGVLMKKMAQFFIEACPTPDEEVRLIAMLQELIKIKKLLNCK